MDATAIATCFPVAAGRPIALLPTMRPAILAHLGSLSDDDLYGRFTLNPTPDLLQRYVQGINFATDICLGIFEPDRTLSGMIHLCVYGPIAELGASVTPAYQRQGRGSALFHEAFERAMASGIREIHLVTGHPAACRIARRLGHVVRYLPGYPGAVIALTAKPAAFARTTLVA